MTAFRVILWFGLMIALGIEFSGLPATAQTTPAKEVQPPAPGLRKLTGEDAKRAEELDKAVAAALKADRWDEAITRAEERLALPARAQGPKHVEMVNADWLLKALRRVGSLPKDDRIAYRSAETLDEPAETLFDQGKFSGARSVCLSLWKVDDTAMALLMPRFYANVLGRRPGLSGPLPKAEALREAKAWLRGLRRDEVLALTAELSGGVDRGKGAKGGPPVNLTGSGLGNVVPSDRLAIPKRGHQSHGIGLAIRIDIGCGRRRVVEYSPWEDAFLLASPNNARSQRGSRRRSGVMACGPDIRQPAQPAQGRPARCLRLASAARHLPPLDPALARSGAGPGR
jgi:hypothetical protein